MRVYLVLLVFVELFIGGSGQIFKVGDFTLRHILFALLMAVYLFDVIVCKVSFTCNASSVLVSLMLFWSIFSALIGVGSGHLEFLIFNDISPMLYFMMYFPLQAYIVKYGVEFSTISKLLTFCVFTVSVVLILIHVSYYVFFDSNIAELRYFYNDFFGDDIFWFRNGGFVFYPSLIFALLLSVLLFYKIVTLRRLGIFECVAYCVALIAILISMTKGLIAACLLGHCIVFLVSKKTFKINLAVLSLCVFVVALAISSFDFSRFKNVEQDSGTRVRMITFNESLDAIDNSFILIGQGFGKTLPSKEGHQENSYMDILVEQGLIGLALYAFVFLHIHLARKNNMGLYLAFVVVGLMSLTNPYINNPLGISIIILCLIYNDQRRVVAC